MVHCVVIIRPPIIVPDADLVMYRLYFAIIKKLFFQQRAGRALCTECHEKFLEFMAGGAKPDEVAKCRGMYNARKSMLPVPDFLVQLRKVSRDKTKSDADRLGMLFDELVGAMDGISLLVLMDDPIETILLFLRWLAISRRAPFTFT